LSILAKKDNSLIESWVFRRETIVEPLEGTIQQLKPHGASLRLRVGSKVNITLQYFDTENKPLDLYYIMDLSATMDDDKPKVATLGTTLARRIRDLTSNVQIGFGSFIDKPIIPFVSVTQQTKAETENSTAPYGFRNHLSLTGDIGRFQQEVKKAKISGNLDAPEGGLDAIVQAAACTDLIGWRESARHLLILSTDGPFHIAGDARVSFRPRFVSS
jgi:protocadherin alpha